MAPPVLPVGVATQLPGRYMLHPAAAAAAISTSGSGRELELSGRTSTSSVSDWLVAVASNSSLGWPLRHADSTFSSEVSGCVTETLTNHQRLSGRGRG